MKKILLIIAVVLCVGVVATALGLAFSSAAVKKGTWTADSALSLTLGSNASSSVILTPGVQKVYPIVCGFGRSPSAPTSDVGELTITLADTIVFSMDKITVTVYTDADCKNPVAGKSRTGAGQISIQNLTQETTFYIGIFVPNDMPDTTGVGGTIKFAFTHMA